jgi:hypothetical protein
MAVSMGTHTNIFVSDIPCCSLRSPQENQRLTTGHWGGTEERHAGTSLPSMGGSFLI